MIRIEFKLSMPGRNSWNGKWSGEERNYTIVKSLSAKAYEALFGGPRIDQKSWSYSFGDGWVARVDARLPSPHPLDVPRLGTCGESCTRSPAGVQAIALEQERQVMHSHTFLPVSHGSHRHRCACGVFGYRRGSRVVPMTCSVQLTHGRCGQEAVEVDGDKNRNRCVGHAVKRAA